MEFPEPLQRRTSKAIGVAPGVGLATGLAAVAAAIGRAEEWVGGRVVVESLVVAILLGAMVRTFKAPPLRFERGIRFAAREILEFAVVLLGASLDLPQLLKAGPSLAIGIVVLVAAGIALSYAIGRLFGLQHGLAVLVACGNAICGNSAIAAVAPAIDASAEDVASAIAFTAILGIVVVMGLPLLIAPLRLSLYQYGVLTGLTVYAVPQVLAAAFPVSVLSGQIATLVKLVRVLMLGPVVLFFSLQHRRRGFAAPSTRQTRSGNGHVHDARLPELRKSIGSSVTQFIPWFIVGFLLLALLRAAGAIPPDFLPALRVLSTMLTVVAMAALGLGCDVRAIMRAGGGVIATVTVSLAMLLCLAVTLIHALGIQ